MSILASPTVVVRCKCGKMIRKPVHGPDAPCELCRALEETWSAGLNLLADIKKLAAGAHPFDVLLPDDRAESIHDLVREAATSTNRYPGFRKQDVFTDETLLLILETPRRYSTSSFDDTATMQKEALAELARRAAQPTEAERDEIEQRCAAEDEDHERWEYCA